MSAKQYSGGCQCGAVRYDVTVDLDNTITCNCSRCGKLGSILAFAPPDAFKLQSGEGELTDYQFNTKAIHHLFCKVCGIQSFARGTTPDGTSMIAINARCLDDIDPTTLSPTHVDGRNF